MDVRGRALPVAFLVLLGCGPTSVSTSGSALLVDMSPATAPRMVGAYDFDLLGAGTGEACVTRNSATVYWVGINDLSRLSSDELTRQAIAAAALEAISRLDDADTILPTRVVTTAKGPDRICATVVGRGIRLTKAAPPPTLAEPVPSCAQSRNDSGSADGQGSSSDEGSGSGSAVR